MVDVKTFTPECKRNPSVAVPTTVLVIDPLDVNTQVVLQRCNLRCMVIKRTAGQACRGEQRGKRVVMFHGRRVSREQARTWRLSHPLAVDLPEAFKGLNHE